MSKRCTDGPVRAGASVLTARRRARNIRCIEKSDNLARYL
jgi:hypothetical protein